MGTKILKTDMNQKYVHGRTQQGHGHQDRTVQGWTPQMPQPCFVDAATYVIKWPEMWDAVAPQSPGLKHGLGHHTGSTSLSLLPPWRQKWESLPLPTGHSQPHTGSNSHCRTPKGSSQGAQDPWGTTKDAHPLTPAS